MADGLAETLYKKIPVNMRIFGESLMGSNAPITEKDFSPEDLQFIKQSYLAKKAKNEEIENLFRRQLKQDNSLSMGLDDKGNLVDNTAQYKKDLERAIKTYDDTRGKTSLSYRDYGGADVPQDAGWLEQVKASFGDNPAYRTGTTLGSFNVHEDPEQGLVVRDSYDWEGADANVLEKVSALLQGSSSPEELGNVLMRSIRPNVSRNVNIKLPKN